MDAPRRPIFPTPGSEESSFLGDLFRQEAVGGMLALLAAAVAVVWANSPWSASYTDLLHLQVGPLDMEHWAADGALTIFFFVAGLELKRELVVGSLRRPADAAVPVVAAACGVAVPALIYVVVNLVALDGRPGGWAIPAATDIAFALAVLAVVGSNLPTALRAFLLTLAVVDDLIVIVIIAVFFTEQLHWLPLLLAVRRVRGVRPAAAGPGDLAAALRAPRRRGLVAGARERHPRHHRRRRARPARARTTRPGRGAGPLRAPRAPASSRSRRRSRSRSSRCCRPGSPSTSGPALLGNPIVVGVVLGLVLGKPIGVFGGAWLVARFTRAELNEDLSWRDVGGVAVLAGIGFTVSLLVAELSFEGDDRNLAKVAVLGGSVIAAVAGALALGHRDRFHATP